MRPLEPLASRSPIVSLLRSAPGAEVRAEIERLASLPLEQAEAAALRFARGAFGLREGSLDEARAEIEAAAGALLDLGEIEAGLYARCEALLAAIRRGPRSAYAAAVTSLEEVLARADAEGHPRPAVVALHYRGTAERLSGDALGTQKTLLEAFRRTEGQTSMLDERAQILNSLGTLYVVLGAHGAAQALLEHAAELAHRLGDATGEAIAHGQLGSAALALGDLPRARKHLQKQEWLASRVGDVFGRTRALTFLADVALDAGRPDEAAELAGLALKSAESVSPPLTLWIAYATRALGRARMEIGDHAAARELLASARARFAQFGNPLGQALSEWDLARLATSDGQAADWFAPAWTLGSLGLSARVARLLSDRHLEGASADLALAAAAQAAPHLSVAQEVELVYGDPAALSAVVSRRTAAQRNLGRLAALTLAPPGLVVAAIASEAIGSGRRALPPERSAGAALLEIPGVVLWGWPASAAAEEIGRDLAALRAALGPDTRAVVALEAEGRVVAPPFPGEVGAAIEGVAAGDRIAAARALGGAALQIGAGVAWSPDAEGRAVMAGFVVRRTSSVPAGRGA